MNDRPSRALAFDSVRALILAGLVLPVGALLFRVDPGRSSLYPRCPFHDLTGLHCPGCGSLRALHQLLHGRPLAALDLNPLLVLSLPILGHAALGGVGLRWRGRPLPRLEWPARGVRWLLGLILLFWLLRNLPVEPFRCLAP